MGREGDKVILENLIDEVASLQKELTKALLLGLDYKRDGKKSGSVRIIEKFVDAAAMFNILNLRDEDEKIFNAFDMGDKERIATRQDRFYIEQHFDKIGWGNIPLNQFSDALEIIRGLNWLLDAMTAWEYNGRLDSDLPMQKYIKHRNGFLLKIRKIASDIENQEPTDKDWVVEAARVLLEDFANVELGIEENGLTEALEFILEFTDACANKYTMDIQSKVSDIRDRMG